MYKAAFGRELGYHVLNDDGTYFHSDLVKDNREICSVVEAKEAYFKGDGNPIELEYTFQTREEAGILLCRDIVRLMILNPETVIGNLICEITIKSLRCH